MLFNFEECIEQTLRWVIWRKQTVACQRLVLKQLN